MADAYEHELKIVPTSDAGIACAQVRCLASNLGKQCICESQYFLSGLLHILYLCMSTSCTVTFQSETDAWGAHYLDSLSENSMSSPLESYVHNCQKLFKWAERHWAPQIYKIHSG